MMDDDFFKKDLVRYLHRQDPSKWGVQVARKDRIAFPHRGVMESISQRKALAARMKHETSTKVPFMQRRFMRMIMRPFVPVFERSRPGDFVSIKKEEPKAEERPRESRMMGMAIRVDRSLRERMPSRTVKEHSEPVRVLMGETAHNATKGKWGKPTVGMEDIKMMVTAEATGNRLRKYSSEDVADKPTVGIEDVKMMVTAETKSPSRKEEQEELIEDGEEKGLLMKKTSHNQGKQQSIKRYMLDGLKDAYL